MIVDDTQAHAAEAILTKSQNNYSQIMIRWENGNSSEITTDRPSIAMIVSVLGPVWDSQPTKKIRSMSHLAFGSKENPINVYQSKVAR